MVQDRGGHLAAVGGQIHGRPGQLAAQCAVAGRGQGRGGGVADDRGGDLRYRRPRLAGQRGQLVRGLGGRTAQALDEGALGHVDDRPGRRAGAYLVQLPALPVDHRRQAHDLLAAARHRSPTFLVPLPRPGPERTAAFLRPPGLPPCRLAAGSRSRRLPLAQAPARARRLPLARASPLPQAMRAWNDHERAVILVPAPLMLPCGKRSGSPLAPPGCPYQRSVPVPAGSRTRVRAGSRTRSRAETCPNLWPIPGPARRHHDGECR